MLKKAGCELYTEHAPHSFIDHRDWKLTGTDEPRQLRVVEVRHHIDIDASGDGLSGSSRGVERNAMVHQFHHCGVIADDEPVEAQFSAQDRGEKKRIGARWYAIQGVEGAHDGGGASFDSGLVRRQVVLAKT